MSHTGVKDNTPERRKMDKRTNNVPLNSMGIPCMSAEDIEVRVSYPLGEHYVSLLLYKDSRYDTKIHGMVHRDILVKTIRMRMEFW